MKKMFAFLITVLFASQFSIAQSTLRVRLADNSRFNISVNGRHFNRHGSSITVGDLPPGKHHLKIYVVAHDRWGSAYDRVIYQGSVYTNYRMLTLFVYDPYTRRIKLKEMPADRNDEQPLANTDNQYRANYDDRSGGNKGGRNSDIDDEQNPTATDKAERTLPAASPIAVGSFTDAETVKLKERSDAKKTDTEKLKLVKDALKRETLGTIQVDGIMDWFLFESTKLEFVKWAYDITIDRENYRSLTSKFEYKSSKEELEQFIRNRK
jgi:hypothetical protein